METCLLCGEVLPKRRWWQSPWLFGGPPMHAKDGPEGDACWRGFCLRMGLDPNQPRPNA